MFTTKKKKKDIGGRAEYLAIKSKSKCTESGGKKCKQ